MLKVETFPNPPIREALIDIHASLPSETNLEKLKSFQKKIKTKFPLTKEKFTYKAGFEFKKEVAPKITSHQYDPLGYLFISSDKKKLAQSRLNGFTFNKLKSYDNWKSFKKEGKMLWKHYIEIAKPDHVNRLGLRYINSIEIPLTSGEVHLEDFLHTRLELPKDTKYKVNDFLLRFQTTDFERNADATITQATEPIDEQGKFFPLILDIEVSRLIKIEPNSEEIWSILDSLRDFKNDIFFSSITEKTKELFR